jgi:hypothetical protein
LFLPIGILLVPEFDKIPALGIIDQKFIRFLDLHKSLVRQRMLAHVWMV